MNKVTITVAKIVAVLAGILCLHFGFHYDLLGALGVGLLAFAIAIQ